MQLVQKVMGPGKRYVSYMIIAARWRLSEKEWHLFFVSSQDLCDCCYREPCCLQVHYVMHRSKIRKDDPEQGQARVAIF